MPEPNSGCLLWLAAVTKAGYGMVNTGRFWATAHRLSFAVHCGPIEAGLQVLHTCDVPICIEPKHLYLGLDRQNGDDRAARHRCRSLRGTDNSHTKLTDKQVMEILVDPRSHRAIAAEYGVSKTPVGQIKQGRGWTHLTGLSRQAPVVGARSGNSKLTRNDVDLIYNDDRSEPEIAADYGICSATVSNIRRKATWREAV